MSDPEQAQPEPAGDVSAEGAKFDVQFISGGVILTIAVATMDVLTVYYD